MVYKYCLVPGCTNTTVKTPEKHFFSLPSDKRRRLKWIFAMRRSPKDISMKSHASYVCQDHFKLEDDLENFVRFQLKSGHKHFLKSEVVPHVFDCQPDRHLAHSSTSKRRTSSKIKERQGIVESLLNQPIPSYEEPEEYMSEEETMTYETEYPPLNLITSPEKDAAQGLFLLASAEALQPFHDKSTQCSLYDFTELRCDRSIQCKIIVEPAPQEPSSSGTPTSSSISTPSGSWKISRSSEDSSEKVPIEQYLPLKATLQLCRGNPKRYIGVPDECMGLITILSRELKCEEKNIFLVLQKIKQNLSLGELGEHYGWSESQCSRLFSNHLIQIASLLKKFIFWPTTMQISMNLPIAFRENFFKVQSIIDCFEIQIEQPSDPVKQSLTWSNYKRCNTMKYLVSSTPNGMINFISEGYGGRISDCRLLKKSGYLSKVPRGSGVMADRGFKGVAKMLENIGCYLIRPPSVASGEKLSKAQVYETRKIASLRIHIERVIRRLREFAILKPHVCLNNKLIKYLDYIVVVACALNNVQSALIKK